KLQREFQKRIGVSPRELRSLFRFNQVKNRLMDNSHLSSLEIALSSGYYDQSHFIRDFKKYAKLNSSEFSQSVIENKIRFFKTEKNNVKPIIKSLIFFR
ncbi:AraC family transcriptional regulator, partial [Leptospira stimsonii]